MSMVSPNPFSHGGGALASIANNAEVVKEMSSIYIAKTFPRDVNIALAEVREACKRPELAALAQYSYPRGNEQVTGPSIRLAEVILAAWGNCESGWRELGRHHAPNGKMVSECEAFAFDKEKNVMRKIAFAVPHVRHTRAGDYDLTDERDIYELCANMSSRRIRACILQIVPGWIVEEAQLLCNKTMNEDKGGNIQERIDAMLDKFDEIGISTEMIEKKLNHPIAEITNKELVSLGRIFNSIKDGFVTKAAVFVADDENAAQPADVRKTKLFDEPEQDEIPGLGADGGAPAFGQAIDTDK